MTTNENKVKSYKMHYDILTKFALENSIKLDYPVLLVGETGVGKTSFIRDIANQRGIELIRLNLTGQTGVDEILGKYIVRANSDGSNEMYWMNGLLIEAMIKGHWIVFDEINMALPEILSALHSLLDDDKKVVLKEKDGSIIRPHQRFRFFATMNPTDEYVGTKELNKAFLSRFPVVLNIDYSKEESDIICERTGMEKNDADKLILAARTIRECKNKEELTYPCSTRDLLYCAELIMNNFKVSDALELAIFNKVDNGERENVKKIFELVTGENIKIETAKGVKSFNNLEDIKKMIDETDKKEMRMKDEKRLIKDSLNKIKKEVTDYKTKTQKNEDKLKQKVADLQANIKGADIIKNNVTGLLTKCKIPKKDINKLFSKK